MGEINPKIYKFIFIASLFTFVISCQTENNIVYKDASTPIEERVDDLLSRMTLEEKFWQLFMIPSELTLDKEKFAIVLAENAVVTFLEENTGCIKLSDTVDLIPKVIDRLIENLGKENAKHPEKKYWSVSQNDAYNFC